MEESTGGTLGIETTVVQTGLQALKFDFPAADGHGIRQSVALDALDVQEEYTISCSVNGTGHPDTIGYQLILFEYDSVNNSWDFHNQGHVFVGGGSTSWVDLSYTVTLNDPDADMLWAGIKVSPQGSPKQVGDFVVDDFSLVKVTPEPATMLLFGLGGLILRKRRA